MPPSLSTNQANTNFELAQHVLNEPAMTTLLLDPTLRRARIASATVAVLVTLTSALLGVCAIELRFGDRPAAASPTRSAAGQSPSRRPGYGSCPAAGQPECAHAHAGVADEGQGLTAHLPFPAPELTAFVDPAIPGSAESLRRHATQITNVVLQGILLGDHGGLVDRIDRKLLRLSHNEGLRTLVLLQNIDEQDGSRRADRVHGLAHDRSARLRLADELIRLCANEHLQGVHLDLERIGEDWHELEIIAADLQRALRREQLELQIDVPPGIDAPLTALARIASGIVIMAYDEYDAGSPAGPIASDAFVESALHSAAARVPAAKLTAALALHGYEWTTGEPAHRVSFEDAARIVRGAQTQLRPGGGNLHAQFVEGPGSRELWVADAMSVRNQAAIAYAANIRSIALWRLGGEDPEVWAALRKLQRPPPARLASTNQVSDDEAPAAEPPSGFTDAGRGGRSGWRQAGTARPPSRASRPITNDLSVDIDDEASRASNREPHDRSADAPDGSWPPRRSPAKAVGRRSVQAHDRPLEDERGLTLSAPFAVPESRTSRHETVALVFEGGANSRSTDRILDELARQHVSATFFVSGAQALRAPELVERLIREGHSLGNGSFLHARLDQMSDARLRLELETTSRLFELLVNRRPTLVRPPVSDDGAQSATSALRTVTDLGYIVVTGLSEPPESIGNDDEAILRFALQEAARSRVVVLRDDPCCDVATLRALPSIVAELRKQGMQLVPLANILGKQREEVMRLAPPRAQLEERLTSTLLTLAIALSRVLPSLLWLAMGLFCARVLLMTTLAIVASRLRQRPLAPAPTPSVTLLMPLFNAGPGVEQTIDSVLASDLPLDVVLIDDGSTNGSAERLSQRYRREPRVRLLRQAHAGKVAALLTGFAACQTEVVITIDEGTRFTTETARNLVEPLRDPTVGAVSGATQVGNVDTALCRWQALESLIHHEIGQRAWSLLGALPTIPSSITAWRRRAVVEAGGFSSATLAAELDLTMTLRRRGWRLTHASHARAFVEAPATLRALVRQRVHSSFGILQALWRHRPTGQESAIRRQGRAAWFALLGIEVVMPIAMLPALCAAATMILAGNLQPVFQAGLSLFAIEVGQLATASLLVRRSGGALPTRLIRSLIASQLFYRPLRWAIELRSIGRLIDGIPLGSKLGHRSAAVAYAVARRRPPRR